MCQLNLWHNSLDFCCCIGYSVFIHKEFMATTASRDTTTGTLNEKEIEKFLVENFADKVKSQVNIGKKRNDGLHVVDMLIGGETYTPKGKKRPISNHKGGQLISLKYQEVAGTAEEKVPFEVMKLQDAIDDYGYESAVIVLCGDNGWTWKEEYLSERFKKRMKLLGPNVNIMSQEEFLLEYSKK